jgi:hypothetical protein
MLRKLNTLTAGIITGVLVPAILYFILVHPKLSRFSFIEEYYGQMVIKFLPLFLSRCIFPNALIFFFLIWRNQLNIAKGILISTGVLTVILVIINFVLK